MDRRTQWGTGCSETPKLDVWSFGRVLGALDTLLPGLPQRVNATSYPFCARAWDIGVELGSGEEITRKAILRSSFPRLWACTRS